MEHSPLETLSACPRCAATTLVPALSVTDHSVTKEVFQLTDCTACNFRFTNPRPTQAEIGRYYQSEGYISHTNSSASLQDRLYHLARKRTLHTKYQLLRRLQPHGKVLDIGCGTGEFLAYLMSRGYLVHGVEPNLKAREQVIGNHGIPVMPSIEQVPAQEQFQVVTMWHVLEHVPDVRATFKKLFALLADRGILVIAVPDRGSWDATHYGLNWAAWDVPRHLSHFRQEDVHALLHEHGFVRVATKRMWLDAFYIALLSEQYKGAGRALALVKAIFVGGWSNLVAAFTGRPTSSSLYVARKAEV